MYAATSMCQNTVCIPGGCRFFFLFQMAYYYTNVDGMRGLDLWCSIVQFGCYKHRYNYSLSDCIKPPTTQNSHEIYMIDL